MNIGEPQKEAHAMAREKGWYERERELPELIALMHSELSEALESWREGEEPEFYHVSGKPEGWGMELADAVIRIVDACEFYGVDLARRLTALCLRVWG